MLYTCNQWNNKNFLKWNMYLWVSFHQICQITVNDLITKHDVDLSNKTLRMCVPEASCKMITLQTSTQHQKKKKWQMVTTRLKNTTTKTKISHWGNDVRMGGWLTSSDDLWSCSALYSWVSCIIHLFRSLKFVISLYRSLKFVTKKKRNKIHFDVNFFFTNIVARGLA